MSAFVSLLVLVLTGPPEGVVTPRPESAADPAAAPSEPAPEAAEASTDATSPAEGTETRVAAELEWPGAEPAPPPTAAPPERSGPPFYGPADEQALRARYGLPSSAPTKPRTARWRCLIADPTCAFTVELNAMGAYAYRIRQGNVSQARDLNRWHSGRAAYDVWLNFATVTEAAGRVKYTRMTLGPKAGVVASDSHDLWGNFGIAGRYWFGRGAWAPALEFSTALSFKLHGERHGRIDSERSPVGITGDVGLNIGGWGAVVVGGQYDTPLAREELPESIRVSAGGMFFVGLRGNILWGLPAAVAVGTHAAVQRAVQAP